jgi:phage shock protein E
MAWKDILIAVAAVAMLGLYFMRSSGTPGFSGDDAKRLVQSGARLVDVRTPQEYASGHIDGAINIPVQELEARVSELAPKDKELVVYCRSGNRTKTAVRILEGAGYTRVYDLGPMSAW